mmetsp:Transcript_28151/g.62817  ORF Transcript_28151/g.62817 Transcript_28151/m.62817 type:complete len:169 (-) Transcript_28151:125-631(-)|eukprot:CAMPEP_0172617192 /NCGR_PEP_ID=MMETSP1068-20121228/70089_1 /TAXON_ID=35684 /ORGANISM="Pseudopedinella elastica, Strain CCMP716" /LENGTH=168 /DNA_ID=CAMNT_0013422889 /DNA_START=151 /DNA_END=654 /DNA_ORIENTATION=-
MSVTGKQGVGIPIILIHDAEGSIVSVELKTGEILRGYLEDAEDNMNLILKDATRVGLDGKVKNAESVFIRGSQISFIVFPGMLKNAPMFKRITIWRKYKGHPPQNLGTATGPRGQAAAIIRKAQERQGAMGGSGGGGGMGGGKGGMGGKGMYPPMGGPMGGKGMGKGW